MRSHRRTVIQPVGECHIIKNMVPKVQRSKLFCCKQRQIDQFRASYMKQMFKSWSARNGKVALLLIGERRDWTKNSASWPANARHKIQKALHYHLFVTQMWSHCMNTIWNRLIIRDSQSKYE